MEWLRRFWFKTRALWRAAELEADMAEEIRAHLDRLEAAGRQAGMPPDAAWDAARRQFGNVTAVKERGREEWQFRAEHVVKDLRYAWRSLRRNPVFAFAVAGSLTLGIGANVTVLSLMRAALWRPLPINHPEQIVHLQRTNPDNTTGAESSFSYVLFEQLREAARDAQVVAKTSARQHKFGLDSTSRERVFAEAVSEDFFVVFGVAPALGRTFLAGDDGTGVGRRIAVLSERFWRRRFDADPAVLGRTVFFDETPFTVVGVAARGFDGVDAERQVQVWIPVAADVAITPQWLRDSSFSWLTLFARVPSSANVGVLQTQLDTRFRNHLRGELLPSMSPRFRSMFANEHLQLRSASAGLATTGRRYEPQLRVLAGVAVCLFLICGANVASLVRARNARRQDEFALRRALGASSQRVFQQLLAEGLLVCGLGILGSLFVSPWIGTTLLTLLPANPPVSFDLRPDLVVLATATALGLASAVVAIAWPGWRQGTGQAAVNAGRRSQRPVVSQLTIAFQLATVLVLLTIAGLSVSMLRRFATVDLGFDPASVLAADLSFPRDAPAARIAATLEGARERLASSGGIESVSYAFPAVYDAGGTSMAVVPADYTPAPGEDTQAGIMEVGPGFFATLRIPVTDGRVFTSADMAGSPPVVIVNASFIRKYFADRSAVGQSLRVPRPGGSTVVTIVGVVGDVRHYGVRSDPWPMVYAPGAVSGARLLVRPRQREASLALIRSAVERVDTTAQVEAVRPLEEIVGDMVSRERLLAVLSSVVAVIAVTLAALGLYGIVAYAVTCRRKEFGIRLTLGAQQADIRQLVLKGTSAIVAIGIAGGLAAALLASRTLSRVVPDAPAVDWPLLFGAASVLVVVTTAAAGIPAWRAARGDPVSTLRSE